MSAVVSVLCTVCNIEFAFSMTSSLLPIGGLSMKAFVAGVFEKTKMTRFVSASVVRMCMFFVGFPSV